MTTKRIYVVTDMQADIGVKSHLVRATSQAQAIHHVVAKRYESRVASQSDLELMLCGGAKVEEAGNA